MRLPARRPAPINFLDLLGWRDAKPTERQDRGPNADTAFRHGADVSAFRAWGRRIVDMAFRPESAQHPIEHSRQSDQFVKRHIRPPVLSEGFHHVGEPSSLTITARHVVQL